jgi:hypothetical protein
MRALVSTSQSMLMKKLFFSEWGKINSPSSIVLLFDPGGKISVFPEKIPLINVDF